LADRYHKEEANQPDKWFKAQVPGAVQLDVMGERNMPNPGGMGTIFINSTGWKLIISPTKPILRNHH